MANRSVKVTVVGTYESGYSVAIKPWLVSLKNKHDNIQWDCGDKLQIHYDVRDHFPDHNPANCSSGPVQARNDNDLNQVFSYSLTVTTDDGHQIKIDPDYRIDR